MEELGLHSQKSQAMFEKEGKTQVEQSKSTILGDTLSFLQDYVNRILDIAYPDYQFEFVGYEKDDPKAIVDIDKAETEAYKTLNEKREEKGLKKLDAEWADIPMNPQAVQLFQSAQAQGGDMPGMGGSDGGADDDSWGDYSGAVMGEDAESGDFGEETQEESNGENEEPQEEESGEMKKSLLAQTKGLVRIRI